MSEKDVVTTVEQDIEQPEGEDALWIQRVMLLVYVAIAASGGLLAAAFAAESQWAYAAICILLVGAGVLAEEVTKVRALNAAAFAGIVFMAMLLVWRGNSAVLPLLATTLALAAWDLHAFRQRLTSVDALPTARAHTHEHLRRLGLTLALGFALGLLGLWARVETSTGLVAGLIMLAAIGLTGAVGFLRRASD